MNSLFRLRFFIPASIGILVLVSLSIGYFISRSTMISETHRSAEIQLRSRMTFLQGGIQNFLARGDLPQIQQLVSSAGSESGVVEIVVTSSDGRVVASNHFVNVDSLWQSLNFDPDQAIGSKVIANKSTELFYSDDRKFLNAMASVCISTGLREQDCGLIFYRLNMAENIHKALESIQQAMFYTVVGVSISMFILLIVLKTRLTNRLMVLISGIEQYRSGKHNVRVNLDYQDEIAELGDSINHLFETIEKDSAIIRENEKRMQSLFESVADAVIIINQEGTIEQINPAVVKLFGYAREELIGNKVNMLMPVPHRLQHELYIKHYLDTGKGKIIGIGRETEAIKKDGTTFPVELSISEIRIGGELRFTGVVRDITDRKKLENSLRQSNLQLVQNNQLLKNLAITDGLTQLANRRYFDEILAQEFNRAKRNNDSLGLILCDIDFFKKYNDTYGHQMGDDCLQKIAAVLRHIFQRGGELPARYGGEEFVVIVPNVDAESLDIMVRKLLNTVRVIGIEHRASDVSEHVTLSIGYVLSYPAKQADGTDELIKAADDALYEAKKQGRNRAIKGALDKGEC